MPTMCIQCAMRALLNDEPPPTFEQTPQEHMAQYHADPVASYNERTDLEQKLAEKLAEKLKGDK